MPPQMTRLVPTQMASCTRCGARVPGGAARYRQLFEEILALEYGDPAYGAVHPLTVHAYALQHSEDLGPRSNAFHLLRRCMPLEHGADRRIGRNPRWLQDQFDGNRGMPHLKPPADRGTLTITDLHGVANPVARGEHVYAWQGQYGRPTRCTMGGPERG